MHIGFTERGVARPDKLPMGFNLASHVGDDPLAVEANRTALRDALPAAACPVWLDQVHGSRAVLADPDAAEPATADASWTDRAGVVCAVLTADCLPVMLSDDKGHCVAAVHAGWRGLVGGVLESTIAAMGAGGTPAFAWLGPAIGPSAFEVGPEVREQFLDAAPPARQGDTDRQFVPSKDRADHFFANLQGLASICLEAAGIAHISRENACTYTQAQRFFSYRRDGQTGRMASFIYRD